MTFQTSGTTVRNQWYIILACNVHNLDHIVCGLGSNLCCSEYKNVLSVGANWDLQLLRVEMLDGTSVQMSREPSRTLYPLRLLGGLGTRV